MRLIDAGQIVYSWFVEEDGTMSDGITLQSIINRLPTIDAVPVIRCKDCKHYYFAGNRVPEEQSWVCDVWHVNQTAHMGYCFKAERRSDG